MTWSLIAVFGAAALTVVAAGPFLAAAAWTAAAGARSSKTRERIFAGALMIAPAVVFFAPAGGDALMALAANDAPVRLAAASPSGDAQLVVMFDWRTAARLAGAFAAAAMAAGLTIQAVSILVRDRRARRYAAGARVEPKLGLRAEHAARRLGVSAVPVVRVTDADVSPFLAPSPRPTVIVPRAMADHLDPDALAAVIAHELAHFARGDRLAGIATSLIASAFWFAPGVGRIAAWLDDAREAECDRLALEFAPNARRAYAHALLTAHAADAAAGRAVAVSFFPRKNRSSYMRIRSILSPSPARPRRVLMGAAALAALTLPVFAGSAALAAALDDDDKKKPVTVIWTDKDGEKHEMKIKPEDGEHGVHVFESEDGETTTVFVRKGGEFKFEGGDITRSIDVKRLDDGDHHVVIEGEDGELHEFTFDPDDNVEWVGDADGADIVIRRVDEDGNVAIEDVISGHGDRSKNVFIEKIEGDSDDGEKFDIIIKRDGDDEDDD